MLQAQKKNNETVPQLDAKAIKRRIRPKQPTKKKLGKRKINDLPPTNVVLEGNPHVKVVRHCAIVVYCREHKKELTEIFHGFDVVSKRDPCQKRNCNEVAKSIYTSRNLVNTEVIISNAKVAHAHFKMTLGGSLMARYSSTQDCPCTHSYV